MEIVWPKADVKTAKEMKKDLKKLGMGDWHMNCPVKIHRFGGKNLINSKFLTSHFHILIIKRKIVNHQACESKMNCRNSYAESTSLFTYLSTESVFYGNFRTGSSNLSGKCYFPHSLNTLC